MILAILYVWISTIGSPGPSWFYLSALGSGISLYGHRFDLPEAVALRWVPSSAAARPYLLGQSGLLVLGAGGGVATHVGTLTPFPATALIFVMALMHLLTSWSNFRWWRDA